MGWARTFLLGDIGNRLDIADAEIDIAGIRNEARRNRLVDEEQTHAIEYLRRENDELQLCIAALIKTLQGKGVLDGAEVARLVALIDD